MNLKPFMRQALYAASHSYYMYSRNSIFVTDILILSVVYTVLKLMSIFGCYDHYFMEIINYLLFSKRVKYMCFS